MSEVNYTSGGRVSGIKFTEKPRRGQTVSGYGSRVPTGVMIQYLAPGDNIKRWYRVSLMQYSNSSSPYILIKNGPVFLGHDVVYAIDAEYQKKLAKENTK